MSRLVISTLIGITCAATVCMAQGQRVRLGVRCKISHERVSDCRHKRSPDVISGELTGVIGDSVRVRTDRAELVIPKTAVAQAWTVDGKRGQFVEGAAIGLVGGVLMGAVVGAGVESCMIECGPSTEFGAIGGAVVGLVLGGIIGSQIHTDRWREIDPVRLSVTPRGRGVGLGMSLAF